MDKEQRDTQVENNVREVATLGGGCFWCLEAVFGELQGVDRVVSGYSGGDVENPTYEQVCSGSTGHAEVVQITFDPRLISYDFILDVFFSVHDPTTLNRQGNDVGTQYRSVIFYHDETQGTVARAKIQEIDDGGFWEDAVVTQVLPLEEFYMAEPYHQDYFKNNPFAGYCRAVISPKMTKFRTRYAENLKR